MKLFAKKANEMAKGRRQKDKVEKGAKKKSKVIEKVTSENYKDYVDIAKKNHKEEIDKIDKLQVEISDKLSRIFGQGGLSLAEKRKLLNEVREGREQVTKEFEKIRTGLLKKGDNKAAKDEAKDLLDSSYDDELPRSRNFYEGEFAKLYRITQNKISTLGELIYADDRAFARKPYGFQPGVINVGKKKSEVEAAMSLWHESGHHLEYSNPNLKTVATNWLKTRSSGEIRSLNELYNTNEFKANEMA